MDLPLKGKGAVVTGGGRGIGAAVAEALSRAGAKVLVAARSRAETAAIARRIGGFSAACDVTKPASVRALARAAGRHLGTVHLLVNAAGIAESAPLSALTLESWNRHLAVNATGTLLCMQAFLPGMLRAGGGRIVNVASTAGRVGGAYIAAYAASKHAVLGLTRSAALEFSGRGITVNAVCPGYVDTDMTKRTLDVIVAKTGLTRAQALKAILRENPQGRLIAAEEVADLVLHLCGEGARGINGQALVLDGGRISP